MGRSIIQALFYLMAMILILMPGCLGVALNLTPSLVSDLTSTFFEECDVALAKEAMPADLKLLEGLHRNAPGNRQLLKALCMGFTGYSILFVEDTDPDRASDLYLRAFHYGLQSMGTADTATHAQRIQALLQRLSHLDQEDLESLFWTTMAWAAWISLNLDKTEALSQFAGAVSCLTKVLELRPDYLFGSPYILMGSTLAKRPKILGGDPAKAKEYFEKAMSLNQGRFFLTQYYFARFYAVQVQDKDLFLSLIADAESRSPDELKTMCLMNRVMVQKLRALREKTDELFL